MIVIPPMLCPTSTTGPVGHLGVEHVRHVAAELVDRGPGQVPPPAATVAALVIEDHPGICFGPQPGALGVEAVQPAFVSVREDDGDGGLRVPVLFHVQLNPIVG